jgi:hypothetical protein
MRPVIVLLALFVSGCASDQAFVQAQADAIKAQADARVEEAKAIVALAGKIDAGGASAYLIATAMSKAQGQQQVYRPRDFLDYLDGIGRFVANVGAVAVPIVQIRESNQTIRAGYSRDVQVEGYRQLGESARIQTVGDIAISAVNAPRPPGIQITAGGDVVNQGGTIDRRNCPTTSAAGAPGGAGGAGGAAPGGPGAPGGQGGAATGGC